MKGYDFFSPFLVLFPKPSRLTQQFLESLRLTAHVQGSVWLGTTKVSGVSGHRAAAGLAEAAEINSTWATGGIEDPEEYPRHSDFTHNKIWGEKGKPVLR